MPASGSGGGTATLSPQTGDKREGDDWAERVVDSLRTRGYFYDRDFSSNIENDNAVLLAARSLGSLFIPSGTDIRRPLILTRPSIRAPRWRAFDRQEQIGWHNDFSTWTDRPEVSLSWIHREDPAGPLVGAWRVAPVGAVLSKLQDSAEGKRLVDKLSREPQPFGYMDADSARFLYIVSESGLRFYGTALTEGARSVFNRVPDHTIEAIGLIEGAADAVGETLPAPTGALLVAHNWLSLHDRTEQTVARNTPRRRARLCFVKKLHRPLSGSCNQIAMGCARSGTR